MIEILGIAIEIFGSSFEILGILKIYDIRIRYPEECSGGIITPVPKLGEIENPDSYCGITITTCLRKLFNLLLNNRLLCFISKKNILKNNQIGFLKVFRTTDVLTIKTLIGKYIMKTRNCISALWKAYVSIWREALFKKLLRYGVSTNFVSLLKNMFEKTKLHAFLGV